MNGSFRSIVHYFSTRKVNNIFINYLPYLVKKRHFYINSLTLAPLSTPLTG